MDQAPDLRVLAEELLAEDDLFDRRKGLEVGRLLDDALFGPLLRA